MRHYSAMSPDDEERHLVELRNHLTTELNRLAELRKQLEPAANQARILTNRSIRNRLKIADLAERVAEQAETFAAHLEARAVGDARDRRLKLAQRERAIAALERRNVARLRAAGAGPLRLESPPSLQDDSEES